MTFPLAAVGSMRGTGDMLTDADDQFLHMVGYTRDDLVQGRIDWRAMTPPEFLHRDNAGMQQARRTGGFTVPYQKEFVHKQGTHVPVLLVCAFVPKTDADWIGYAVDLSPPERMSRQEDEVEAVVANPGAREFYGRLISELVCERQRMVAMLDNTDGLIWAIDPDRRLLSANRRFQDAQRRFSGRELEIGESVLSADIPAELRAPWIAWYARALTGERFTTTRAVEIGGAIEHTEHRFSPIRDATGSVIGVSVLAQDITEHVNADTAVRKSEERFRSLADSSPLGVFLSDPDGRCHYVNERLAALWGIAEPEMLGWGFTTRMHESDRARTINDWRVAVETGSSANLEFRIRQPDGSERQLRVLASPIRDRGTVTGFVGSVEDVTEQRALAQRLRQKEKMESLGTLAGGVAHDFNNMLGIVLGHAELALSEPALPRETHEHLTEIQTASARARDLVQQILAFSRRVDRDLVPVDLRELTLESVRLLRSAFPANVTLDVQIGETPLVVLGDAAALQQIIVNLCTNAEFAMRGTSEGVLTLALTADGAADDQHALLTVRDTGHGMSAEVRARALEPFFTTKALGEGTGMGLSVVHGIVASYGGGLAIDSEEGLGTTVRVALPLTDQKPAPVVLAAPVALPSSGRVLLVEDEHALARFAERALIRAGYSVTVCHDGALAFECFLAAPHAFDLVITDLTMPGMTGDRLVLAMREVRADISAIVMTGFSSTITAGNSTDYGIDALLEKPFSAAQLAACARAVLDR